MQQTFPWQEIFTMRIELKSESLRKKRLPKNEEQIDLKIIKTKFVKQFKKQFLI